VRCTLRATLRDKDREAEETAPIAVGDRVTVRLEREEGVIEAIAPRINRLVRPETGVSSKAQKPEQRGGRAGRYVPPVRLQVLAANIDRLIVVTALTDPPFRAGLVDRFLVAAAAQGIDPVLCLNKVDLGDASGVSRDVVAPYIAAGFHVLATSCTTGEGIDVLAALMRDSISLLAGHSGVGKSSLLNAVSPGLRLQTGTVTEHHGRGRHTTTHSTLLPLAGGGFVVDSPGIREFGVSGVTEGELARLYPGFGTLPDGCRFNDCRHRLEPGCAVRAAVAAGTLAADRHETYLRLLEDLQ
jgi:ribosome biogenesis GTPase